MSTKVLVVDDSVTMRALFSNVLEGHKDIEVVGMANGADEARVMIEKLRPDVITLDVEMPGKSGIEFLAELMEVRPTRVVMLSTLTQKGADTTLKAIELGAVDCFAKPARSTPDEFKKISASLCKTVLNAAKCNLDARKAKSPANAAIGEYADYVWDGSLVAIAGNVGAIDPSAELLRAFPPNCPPTVVTLAIEEALAAAFAASLAKSVSAIVKVAEDGAPLVQGTIYVAANPEFHVVVDKWPQGTLRFVAREPVNDCRPSADLLFASIAKTAASKAVCVILSGAGSDGAMGLAASRAAGALCLAQTPDTALVREAIDAATLRNAVAIHAPADVLVGHILRSSVTAAAA